jgi:hypothetical protein
MPKKPPTRYVFAVCGTGEFPTDMLRYDECKPLTDDDRKITEAKYHGDERNGADLLWDDEKKRLRRNTVWLVSERGNLYRSGILPTKARWRSFMWAVVEEPKPEA